MRCNVVLAVPGRIVQKKRATEKCHPRRGSIGGNLIPEKCEGILCKDTISLQREKSIFTIGGITAKPLGDAVYSRNCKEGSRAEAV